MWSKREATAAPRRVIHGCPSPVLAHDDAEDPLSALLPLLREGSGPGRRLGGHIP